MKTQFDSVENWRIVFNARLWVCIILFLIPMSCFWLDEVGGDGPSDPIKCALSPSLFDGDYRVMTNNCDAIWGDSVCEITLQYANNPGVCEWAIQNLFCSEKAISGVYDYGSSELIIDSQNFFDDWLISGKLSRYINAIEIDITLTSTILDTTIICTVTGIKN